MQDSWLSKKSDEIQSFVDRKDMKKFYDALKTLDHEVSICSLIPPAMAISIARKTKGNNS